MSASGALIETELGICPAAHIAVETLTPALGHGRELLASIVRAGPGEMAVEWLDLESSAVRAVLTETRLNHGANEAPAPALRRVPFCALSSAPVA